MARTREAQASLNRSDRCHDCAILQAKGMSGFDVALHHIESEILAGNYVPGMQLPPERDLAARLSVGRGAVREAIRVLQAQGIVVSGTGPGNGTRIRTTPGDALGRMLRLQLALDVTSVEDLTETRVVVEKAAAGAAARQGPGAAVRRAEMLVGQMGHQTDPDSFNELDTSFHIAIIEASGNHMLSMLSSAIRHTLSGPIRQAEERLDNWDEVRTQLVAEHRGILEAVRARDPALASELVERHIRHSYEVLLPSGFTINAGHTHG